MLLGGCGAKRQENKGEAGVTRSLAIRVPGRSCQSRSTAAVCRAATRSKEASPLRQEHVAVTMIDAAWRFGSAATGKRRGRLARRAVRYGCLVEVAKAEALRRFVAQRQEVKK